MNPYSNKRTQVSLYDKVLRYLGKTSETVSKFSVGKFPKIKGSKYKPHQGQQEKNRRLTQREKGFIIF